MRRVVMLLLVVLAPWLASVGAARPAAACSCAPPAPPTVVFDGTAIDAAPAEFGELWTFTVDDIVEGDEIGEEAEVIVDAGHSSSCGIGLVPQLGAQYRIVVLPSEDGGPFHVNLCSGSMELVAAVGPGSAGGSTGAGNGTPWGLLVVGGLAGVTVAGVGLLAVLTRRRSPSS